MQRDASSAILCASGVETRRCFPRSGGSSAGEPVRWRGWRLRSRAEASSVGEPGRLRIVSRGGGPERRRYADRAGIVATVCLLGDIEVVPKVVDHVQEMVTALKNMVKNNLSTENTPADVELNKALLEVDNIARDLEQLVFQVEDAMRAGGVGNQVCEGCNVEDEGSCSKDVDDDDVVPADWSPDDLSCGDSVDSLSVEFDWSWRL